MNDPFEDHAGKHAWIEHTMLWIGAKDHPSPAMVQWMKWAEQRMIGLKEEMQ